jgi:hypothetical protein
MALSIYALTGLVPVHGFVLCVGPEGHFTIELAALDGSCFDCSPASNTEDSCCPRGEDSTRDAHDSVSDCDCTDLLILVGHKQSGVVLTFHPTDWIAPPDTRSIDAIAHVPARPSNLLARSTAPIPPRVSSNLVLRV